MKFSIVTPSFNQGRYIRDCIESVQSQEGVEWEHIVVDACSTDETVSVLKEYPHLQWTSEKDQGMSDGINKGFVRATGDWVMWLNTDDYLLPNTLQKVAKFAAAQKKADIIYGECLFVGEDKQLIRHRRDHAFDSNILLFYGCHIPSTSTFLKRQIIEAGDLLDVNYRVCMDFEYYVRLAHLGYQFTFLPEALAGFRWHETNTSSVHVKRRRQERLQVQREYLQKQGRSWMGSKLVLQCLFRFYQMKRATRRLGAHFSSL